MFPSRFVAGLVLSAGLLHTPFVSASESFKTPPPGEVAYTTATYGTAQAEKTTEGYRLANGAVEAVWSVANGKLNGVSLTDKTTGIRLDLAGSPVFRLGVDGVGSLGNTAGFVPLNLDAADFVIVGAPKLETLRVNPKAVKQAERSAGKRLVVNLKNPTSGIDVRWIAELRDGSHYLRTTLMVTGTKGVLTGVCAVDVPMAGATRRGTAVAGNPVANDAIFIGLELPMGLDAIEAERVRAGVACKLPLERGAVYEFSSVIGVYPKNQLRRAFLAYLERERAMPYTQFLHYNGWFDFDRNVTEKGMLATIADYDRELIKKHKVPVKAFVIDDGWDDWDGGFWAINRKKFPNEFKRVGSTLNGIGSRFGIWISPLAGYDHSDKRIAHAAKAGLTPNGAKHLDLSYPPYYKWFLDRCTKFIRDDKTAYFKFDKAGSGVNAHFLALLRICRELRLVDPQVVINITVGTWPSPFWLNHIDCTWREGGDMGHEGPGNARETWITYRDAQTWRGVVSKGPLYPLNSIMNHGIVLSDGHFFARDTLKGKGNMAPGGTDLRNEARSFFGSGTMMQELYVKPSVTPPETWAQIAEAAKWASAHEDILVDTHWVGGNPSKGACVYGWAAWAPRKALLTLRNPSDKDDAITLDPAEIFELPVGAATRYRVTSAYKDWPAAISNVEAGKPFEIKLKPFEVTVLEFTPEK